MPEPLVLVENISKKFCRGLKRSMWYGIQDVMSEMIGRNNNRNDLRPDEFWAVRDVSVSVDRGETLGLIGHNGAGKTTLLRMLNGLIKPTDGRILIRGRMQALIALGAGFNPVLTGRENIYVNASVLGISKSEIDRRFDEIVAFSGIEEFLDMPVQSYSSGMTVRLGFSVAAHLDPDILLVDEVLAVGDLAFRTKCQVRIQEMKDNGVAIILVSHNLHTISHVCSRAITMDRGQIIFEGNTDQAIDAYRASLMKNNRNAIPLLRGGTGEIRIQKVEILNKDDLPRNDFIIGESVKIRIHYHADKPVNNPVLNIAMQILNSYQVSGIRNDSDGIDLGPISGDGFIDISIPNLYLLPNIYTLDAVLFHQDGFTFYDRLNNSAHINVVGGHQVNGMVYIPHSWHIDGKTSIPSLSSLTESTSVYDYGE